MTIITRKEYNERFAMEFPEMIECFEIDDESFEELLDGSDTYVDVDDYEYQQTLY